MNYNEIVNRFKEIVNDHNMLVDFGYGQLSDIKTRSEGGPEADGADYPYLFLNPGTHLRTQRTITYSFNMIIMDMAREEEAGEFQNFLNIQSNCIQYCDDVIARLYYHYKDKPEISFDVSYVPFYERFQDNLAGATATISIEVPTAINECIAPFVSEPYETFATATNNFSYTNNEGGILRYETNILVDNSIGNFDDIFFDNAITGSFQFKIEGNFRFGEPTGTEVMPREPVLSTLISGLPETPAISSSGWPTTWPGSGLQYFEAIYEVSLADLYNFTIVSSKDGPRDETQFTQEIGGTITIGYRA